MKVYIVGGYLRDMLLGISAQDKDYVVVGATVQEMLDLGFRPVGQDFPVFLHPQTQAEYALARTEKKSGQGYKGFTFYTSPEVTLEQDLFRRDLTINAIAQEIDNEGNFIGALIDPYGGQHDLQNRLLRHVSPAFEEDPLRILRLARLMAKLEGFTIDAGTLQLLKIMVERGELKHLVPERIWLEISKGLVAKVPSRMLDVLLQIGATALLPEGLLVAEVFAKTKSYLNQGAQLGNDLACQFAYFCCAQSPEIIQNWSAQMRVPNDIKQFAYIFARFAAREVNQIPSAEDVMLFFDAADAWRKAARLHSVFLLASQIGLKVEVWQHALQAALQVNAGEIALQLHNATGQTIQAQVAKARTAAVAACL